MVERIDISKIWLTQRSLKRMEQIPAMMKAIAEAEEDDCHLPPIELHRSADGAIVLQDGHHRLTAYWLSGYRYLPVGQFVIYELDSPKGRLFRVEDFCAMSLSCPLRSSYSVGVNFSKGN